MLLHSPNHLRWNTNSPPAEIHLKVKNFIGETDRQSFKIMLTCSTNGSVNLWWGLPPTSICSQWRFNFPLPPLRTHCTVTVKWNRESPFSRRSNLSDFLLNEEDMLLWTMTTQAMKVSWGALGVDDTFSIITALINPHRATGQGAYIQRATPMYSLIILQYILSACADEDKIFF